MRLWARRCTRKNSDFIRGPVRASSAGPRMCAKGSRPSPAASSGSAGAPLEASAGEMMRRATAGVDPGAGEGGATQG